MEEHWERPLCAFCESTSHILVASNVRRTGHDMVECVCGLRFYSPRMTEAGLEAAGLVVDYCYQVDAENQWAYGAFKPVPDPEKQKAGVMRYYRSMIRRIVPAVIPRLDSVFEVGGGVGWFLRAAQDEGASVLDGCDLNHHAVRIQREGQGFEGVVCGHFCDHIPSQQYDLIVALDYIEHTRTPFDDLRKMREMARLGGALLLKTFTEEGNADGHYTNPAGHPIHFWGRVLRRMIQDAGWEIVSWLPEGAQVLVIARRPA